MNSWILHDVAKMQIAEAQRQASVVRPRSTRARRHGSSRRVSKLVAHAVATSRIRQAA